MSPKVRTLLSEKNIYVSWGILILAITCTYVATRTLYKVDETSIKFDQVYSMMTSYDEEVKSIDNRVSKLETAMAWVTEMYNRDIQTPNK